MQAGKYRKGEEQTKVSGKSKEVERGPKYPIIFEKIKMMRLLDDDLMTRVFEGNFRATELLLRIFLNRDDLTVTEIQTQYVVKNLQGRSIRMDIRAKDREGVVYNIEIQRADAGAGAKRARYNSSLIDADCLLPGDDVKMLPNTYVIFITENDIFGKGLPIYHVDRVIRELDQPFGDGAHILYVNGAYQGDSDIGKLMHDFRCTDPNDMHFPELKESVRYYKENEEGVNTMCKVVEELCNDARKEGREEGRIENLKKSILAIADILSAEEIAKRLQVSLDFVKSVLASGTAQQRN